MRTGASGYLGAAMFVAAFGIPLYVIGQKAQDEQDRKPAPVVVTVPSERVGIYCTWDDWDRAVHHGDDTVRDDRLGCYKIS